MGVLPPGVDLAAECVRGCVRACVRAFVRACVRACVRMTHKYHNYTMKEKLF